MTTLFRKEICCSQCGRLSEHEIIMSTSSWGSPDLDRRPAEPMRSTLRQQVQTCPSCGYCASDITRPAPDVSRFLMSSEYRQQLQSNEYPELANLFRCAGLVLESCGHLEEAAWACIRAAWACDDAASAEAARKCRLQAEQLLGQATTSGQGTANRPGFDCLMRVDLLRRAGEVERASKVSDAGFSRNCDSDTLLLLVFERVLSRRRDTGCHTVEEGIKVARAMYNEYEG